MRKYFHCLLLTAPLLSLLGIADLYPEEKFHIENKKEVWVTILVHGIISVKPHLSISNIVKIMRDNIADSVYGHAIEIIRKDPFFYEYHPMQELGLKPIDVNNVKKGAGATAFARAYDTIAHMDNTQYPNNLYYTFGWSGLLSPKMRALEAEIFLKELFKLLKTLRSQNLSPKFRIVGYSHGGNVVLKLAEVYSKQFNKQKIAIDELILIGLPVLEETDYLICHPLFKKIYHLYSYGDRIQKMDCFSFERFFSGRRFHKTRYFAPPEKLVQILVKVKRPIAGKEFIAQDEKTLDYLLHNSARFRNADPGHTELWSFGWTPTSYRFDSFPFNPLPFAVLTPYLLHSIEKTVPGSKNLMAELHPFYDKMILYDCDTKTEFVKPFLSNSFLDKIKKDVEQFRPNNFTLEEYNRHIKEAIDQAKKYRAQTQIKISKPKKQTRLSRYPKPIPQM